MKNIKITKEYSSNFEDFRYYVWDTKGMSVLSTEKFPDALMKYNKLCDDFEKSQKILVIKEYDVDIKRHTS